MHIRLSSPAPFVTLCVFLAAPLAGQGGASEVAELRGRVATIRAHLPQITGVAQKSAAFLGHESTSRFLIPRQLDPAFYLEFLFRAGGPPDTHDTGDPDAPGLVLLPVRHWIGVGLGVAGAAERWQSMQRPVVIIGPANGRPSIALSGSFIDNGAPNGDREHASINGIANMIVGWTFYTEIVAAATRAGWQPGILLSVLAPGASADKPTFNTLRWLITNGAPDGSRANAGINGGANMIAAWTRYVEFVASATRHHWQPGVYVSNLIPDADDSNLSGPVPRSGRACARRADHGGRAGHTVSRSD